MIILISFSVVIIFLVTISQLVFRIITKKKSFDFKMFLISCVLCITFIICIPKQAREPVKIASYPLYSINNESLRLDSETKVSRLDSVTYKGI